MFDHLRLHGVVTLRTRPAIRDSDRPAAASCRAAGTRERHESFSMPLCRLLAFQTHQFEQADLRDGKPFAAAGDDQSRE